MKKLMNWGLLLMCAGAGAAIFENVTGIGIQRPKLLSAGTFAAGGMFVGAVILLWVMCVDVFNGFRNWK